MDLNHLRSFVSVAQFGHLTRASEALHLSQPALSSHIKTLEEQFGVMLFDRTPSGMVLTPSGRRLLTDAEAIIGAVRRMVRSAQNLRGRPTGILRLGTVLDPSVLRVGELMARMLDRYPQIEVELHQVISHEAVSRVRTETLEASFYFGPPPGDDLASTALREMLYRVMLPAAWADTLGNATWPTLAEQPWVVAPQPSSHHRLVMGLFDGGDPPQKIIEADSESVINNLVESGVGVSLIRDEIAAQSTEAGRSAIWPLRDVTTTLWLLHRHDRATDPMIAALRDVAERLWSTDRGQHS
jgi:DNA-binding transcriptional LysR family regulator